jgi:hypothetical protein
MAELFCKAYDKSAGIETAKKGFETTGLWPFDDQKFTDEDFLAAEVTDEPLLTTPAGPVQVPVHCDVNRDYTTPTVSVISNVSQSSTAAATPTAEMCSLQVPDERIVSAFISEPESRLPPRPKLKSARPRTRKAESAVVLTSSPYKTMLQEKANVEVERGVKRKNTASAKATKAATKKPA